MLDWKTGDIFPFIMRFIVAMDFAPNDFFN